MERTPTLERAMTLHSRANAAARVALGARRPGLASWRFAGHGGQARVLRSRQMTCGLASTAFWTRPCAIGLVLRHQTVLGAAD